MTALALFAVLAAPAASPPTLYRVRVGGRYGFIDREGRTVVPPTLKDAGRFREGLAWFSRDGRRYGYLDTRGRTAVAPRFAFAADFSDGMAAAGVRPVKDGWATYGFVDRSGELRVPERYRACEPDPGDAEPPLGYAPESPEGSGGIGAGWFERGRAKVGYMRWIDRRGRSVPPAPQGNSWDPGPPREGVRSVYRVDAWTGSGELWYERAADGSRTWPQALAVPPRAPRKPSPRLNYYSEGRAPTWFFPRGGGALLGYVDPSGGTPIAPVFEEIRPFRGGLAEVVRAGRTEYIDRYGRRAWPRP